MSIISSKIGYGFVPTSIFIPGFGGNAYRSNNVIVNSIEFSNYSDNASVVDVTNADIQITGKETARLAFEKLYKNKDTDTENDFSGNEHRFTDNSASDLDYSDFNKKFYQLAEKRIYKRAELEYQEFIEKRENKIRAKAKKQRELEEYNNDLLKKTIEAKIKAAEKKRARREFVRFWVGVLLGDDDDPSIPKPMLCVLQNQHYSFVKFLRLSVYKVESIQPISPVSLGESFYSYSHPYSVRIKFSILKRKLKGYLTFYRRWLEQFVRKIIEKRQRGPPFFE